MAGVPTIMQTKLKIGVRMLSEIVRVDTREGDIGMQLGGIANANPAVAIGSYPFFDPQHRRRLRWRSNFRKSWPRSRSSWPTALRPA